MPTSNLSISVTCPHCAKVLRLSARPAEGKKIKCPACEEPFVPEFDDDEKGFQSKPGKTQSASNTSSATRRADEEEIEEEEEERPNKKKKKKAKAGSNMVMFLLLSGGGFLFLALGGVGITAFVWPGFMLSKSNDRTARKAIDNEKEKPADKEKAKQTDNEKPGLDKLEGNWIVLSMIRNGVEEKRAKGEPYPIKDGKIGGDGPGSASFTTRTDKNPMEIDLQVDKNLSIPGIFKFEQGKLYISIGDPIKKERPKSFDAPGAGHTILRPANKEDVLYSRTRSEINLKIIGLALHGFHGDHKSFPAAFIGDKDGKPLLSWRVAILPYIDEEKLYGEFDLNKPWDDPHNQKLIAKMPKTYLVSPFVANEGKTHYRAMVGPGTPLEPKKNKSGKLLGLSMLGINDGTAFTAAVVEAKEPTIWTKPDDLPYDPKGPLPKFGVGPIGFHLAMADGVVYFVRYDVPEAKIRPYLTGNNGIRRESIVADEDNPFRPRDDKDFKDKDSNDKDIKDKDIKDKEAKLPSDPVEAIKELRGSGELKVSKPVAVYFQGRGKFGARAMEFAKNVEELALCAP